ncbi:MAG: hypothetical protein HRT71_20235, partial [Flavobacteriales bacterium]|nr:hypothetical protein [Flavobacteriales bacterium]
MKKIKAYMHKAILVAFATVLCCVFTFYGFVGNVSGQSLPSTGLVLHYDAQDVDGDGDFTDQPSNGSVVSSWSNQSSSADAVATAGNEPTFDANGININGAISFDGTNDLFTIANSTDLNTEATTDEISLAIVLETGASVAGEQIIYEQGGGARGYSFVIQNSHIYAGVWNNIEWDASHQYKSVDLGSVSPNTIYFITIVQSSSSGADATNTLSIYLNGSLASSVSHVDPQIAHWGAIGLGRINGGTVLPADDVVGSTANTDYFQGLIGEFLIWKNALPTTDITGLNTYFLDRWSIQTPPTLDLNGLASNGQDFQAQFSEGGIPANIANSGSATITDIESTYLSQITFKVSNALDGTDEVFNINGTDIILNTNGVNIISAANNLPKLQSTVSAGTGADADKQILLLESVDGSNVVIDLSITDAQAILRGITYENQLATVTPGTRDIEITATDTNNKESAVVNSEVEVIAGAPDLDLNGPSTGGANYTTSYVNLLSENICDGTATITTVTNLDSLELFLAVQDLNLENFNISGTAIDISSNGVTNITTTPENLTVTVSEVLTGLNAGKQSVLIEPANSITASQMQTLLLSITYKHLAGTFSTNDRIIGVVVTDINNFSSSQVNTTLDIASPPVNSVPGEQFAEASTLLSITNISCSDADGDLASVRLEAKSSGSLSVTASGGVELSGNDSHNLLLTGTEIDINATLATLKYTSVITTGTETLEVTATDDLATTDIDEVPITINPPPLSGLVLHYDAQDIDGDGDLTDQPTDGANVTTWTNQSSSGDATATGGNEPTFSASGINSNGAVSFDGTNDFFSIANSNDLNTEATTEEISLAIVLETGASVAGEQIIYEQGGGARGYSFVIQNSHIYAGVWNNLEWDASHQYKSVDLGSVSANTTYFITIVQNSSSGVDATNTLSIYLNGTLVSSVTHVDAQTSHADEIGLGRINGGTVLPADEVVGTTANTDFFQGLIGEFMIWKNALSSTEIDDLNTYFLDRWGITTPPTIDLNGLASNGQDYQTQYSEGGIPVNITSSGSATITDIESTDLSQMTFKMAGLADGTDEVLNINGTDIILSSNGVIIISAVNSLPKLQSTVSAGTGADAGKQILLLESVDGSNVVIGLAITDAQSILRAITYENQSGSLTTGNRDIGITATDTDSKESAVVNSEIEVIVGAPTVDLNGASSSGGNYTANYINLTTENISDATATITAANNLESLELFLDVQDLNLENFNISGTAIDISSNGVTNITTTPENLTVTVSEVLTGLNAGKQSVLIEPANSTTASQMQTLLLSITYEHVAGTFSTSDRVIGVVVTDVTSLSSSQVNTTLQAIDAYEWTGATSSVWNVATNWDNSVVPPSGANITIPNTDNQPVLDQNRTIGDLTCTNSTFDLNSLILNIEGDVTVTTSVISGGEVIFSGTGAKQFISIVGTLSAEDLTINNSNNVEISTGSINLAGTLTLTDGDLITNNGLTLTSTSTQTARIAEIIGGSLVGNITMQTFYGLASGSYFTGWHEISSCITGATVNDWQDDFQTCGYSGAEFTSADCGGFASTGYYFDESLDGGESSGGWQVVTS